MIPREILKKIRQIELRTNRLVTETLGGQYHSVFKGRGMNFDAVREYVPGDEVRTIDWNVTARAGRPFVKKFVEERELTLLLMVDVSASGDFGSGEAQPAQVAGQVFRETGAITRSDVLIDMGGLCVGDDDVEGWSESFGKFFVIMHRRADAKAAHQTQTSQLAHGTSD